MITSPVSTFAIVDSKGVPTPEFVQWMNLVSALDIVSGTGSPEGVVSAKQRTLYMDTTGSSGSILYVKKTTADNTGWVAV